MYTSVVDIGVATIKTTVTEHARDINRVVKSFLSNSNNRKKIIGVDTERVQKARNQNRTALLQLCDGDNCLVVELPSGDDNVEAEDDLPLSLFNFLNLPDYTFVGIGIDKTLMRLESEFGLTCKNAVEIGPATWSMANRSDIRFQISRIVSTQKPTSPVFDDWETSGRLSKNQIKLAVSNAYLAFGVGNSLLDGFGF